MTEHRVAFGAMVLGFGVLLLGIAAGRPWMRNLGAFLLVVAAVTNAA